MEKIQLATLKQYISSQNGIVNIDDTDFEACLGGETEGLLFRKKGKNLVEIREKLIHEFGNAGFPENSIKSALVWIEISEDEVLSLEDISSFHAFMTETKVFSKDCTMVWGLTISLKTEILVSIPKGKIKNNSNYEFNT